MQYNLARFEKSRKDAEAEAARARSLNAQVLTFSKTETELRSQLNIYVEKFKQVGPLVTLDENDEVNVDVENLAAELMRCL